MPTDRSVPYRIYLLIRWLEAADDRADPETRCGRCYGCVGVKALVAGLISMISNDDQGPKRYARTLYSSEDK